MTRRYVLAVLGVLAHASLVLAQAQSVQLPPPPPAAPTDEVAVIPPADPPPFEVDPYVNLRGMLAFDVDYVAWIIPNREQPVALAGTSSGTPTIGEEHLDRHVQSGARVALGYWLTQANPFMPGGFTPCLGVETRFFAVAQRSFGFNDAASSVITRPFFDLNDEQPSAVIVAAPGLASGAISATVQDRLWGAEANVWKMMYFDYPMTTYSIEAMVGMRYLDMDESFSVTRFSQFVTNPQNFPAYNFLAGSTIHEQESFATRNQFWGGQVGIRGRLIFESAFVVSGTFQLGLGTTNERITIEGSQTRTLPGGTSVTYPGGLLALPSNIGTFERNKFTQVPAFDINIACPVTNHLTLSLGFNALYWSRLVRPENQIDRVVDITQIPNFPGAVVAMSSGQQRPVVPFSQSNLWLLGVLIGAEVRW
jgi:hypothetical protein